MNIEEVIETIEKTTGYSLRRLDGSSAYAINITEEYIDVRYFVDADEFKSLKSKGLKVSRIEHCTNNDMTGVRVRSPSPSPAAAPSLHGEKSG